MQDTTHVEIRGQLTLDDSRLSLYHVSIRIQTHNIGLGSQHPYALCHLFSPGCVFKEEEEDVNK